MRYTNLIMLLLLIAPVLASDLAREQRIAAELQDSIQVGYPTWLNTGQSEFFAIHTESTLPRIHGGLIILHGIGSNPNRNDVVFPLRSQLPESGWETLSIQLPTAAPDAPSETYRMLIPEAFPRIAAAVGFLRQRGVERIALVGHSWGGKVALEYLAHGPVENIEALVAVGLSASKEQPVTGTLAALQKVKLPILDIYGSQDLEPVLTTAEARTIAARRAENSGYQQLQVPGADHFFNGLDDQLVQRVRAWLHKTLVE